MDSLCGHCTNHEDEESEQEVFQTAKWNIKPLGQTRISSSLEESRGERRKVPKPSECALGQQPRYAMGHNQVFLLKSPFMEIFPGYLHELVDDTEIVTT
jgi:hypothetical protein